MKKQFLTLLILLSAGFARAQVTVSGTGIFDLSTHYARDTIYIPLKIVAPATFDKLTLVKGTPYITKTGNINKERYSSAITISKDTQRKNRLVAIVTVDRLDIQASYDVSVEYFTDDPTMTDYFNFSLVRPAAMLEGSAFITGDTALCKSPNNQITIRETSDRAGVNNLRFVGMTLNNSSVSDLITFDSTYYHIPAGTEKRLICNVHIDNIDKLPLGIYQGKLRFSSPMLTAPVEVNIVVSHKLGKWLIFVIVILGLFSGVGVRVILQQQKDAEQARLTGFQLIRQIIDDSSDVHDEPFRVNVTAIIDKLKKLLEKKGTNAPNAAAINAAVTIAQSGYSNLITKLQADLKAASDTYNAIANPVFKGNWGQVLSGLLFPVKKELREIRDDLSSQNVTDAQSKLSLTVTNFNAFVTAYVVYIGTFIKFLNGGAFYPVFASDDTKTAIIDIAGLISGRLTGITAPVADYLTTLTNIEAVQEMAESVRKVLEEKLIVDENGKTAANPAFQGLFKIYIEQFTTMALNAENENDVLIYYQSPRLDKLNDSWNAAIALPVAKSPLFNFAMQPLSLVMNNSSPLITMLANTIVPPDFFLKKHSKGSRLIDAEIAATNRRFTVYSLFQTILLTLLIGLAAYKGYGSSFIGNCQQVIGLFLVAFSADITTNSITSLQTKSS